MTEFLQFLISGLQVGAVYALAALGFTLVYNVSNVINLAQGEFIMLGGMLTVFLNAMGVPILGAATLATVLVCSIGMILYVAAIYPAKDAPSVNLIIITIGASIFIRGLVSVILGKDAHRIENFSSDIPIDIFGAKVLTQTFWIIGGALLIFFLLYQFFNRSLYGKAILATANDRIAALLVGINIRLTTLWCFALSAGIGAIAGILITPITITRYDIGVLLALKGFSAAILGGMGSPLGALLGGLMLGLVEQFTAGYLSSSYKDAAAFFIVLIILSFKPSGMFGRTIQDRV